MFRLIVLLSAAKTWAILVGLFNMKNDPLYGLFVSSLKMYAQQRGKSDYKSRIRKTLRDSLTYFV